MPLPCAQSQVRWAVPPGARGLRELGKGCSRSPSDRFTVPFDYPLVSFSELTLMI